MNLEDFPMDIQRCPLKFGSFGYTVGDVVYRWNKARQVAIAEDMKLSQFDLIATPSANQTDQLKSGEYSMLLVSFHLQRHMGNFLIQVYGPCVLLVVLSWVSFWLNREATADRVSLGDVISSFLNQLKYYIDRVAAPVSDSITTVLTMTFLGLEARTDLPKVSYPTALDFFVFLSFGFIFATIIQFAVVHYFTKYGSGECYFTYDVSSESSSEDEAWRDCRRQERRRTSVSFCEDGPGRRGSASISGGGFLRRPSFLTSNSGGGGDKRLLEVIPLTACSVAPKAPPTRRPSWALACLSDQNRDLEQQTTAAASCHRLSIQEHAKKRRKKRTPRYNSVSKIDRTSRVVFPLCFMGINVFYWYSYLSRSQRIHQRHADTS
uniref:Uncharacterized protein n=1 Tax=Timema cristinae TaxID=61476 RepID=A0A7R9DDX9_TIMCR|nr:unnamed protein product [Timema cristinae]